MILFMDIVHGKNNRKSNRPLGVLLKYCPTNVQSIDMLDHSTFLALSAPPFLTYPESKNSKKIRRCFCIIAHLQCTDQR